MSGWGSKQASTVYRYGYYWNNNQINVEIPQGCTEIDKDSFPGCRDKTNIASITIPNSVTKIGERAFCNLSSLTNITIPNSVTGIGSSAFSGCSSLTNITIPNRVTSISECAFLEC